MLKAPRFNTPAPAVEKLGFAGANPALAFRSICCAVGAPLMPA